MQAKAMLSRAPGGADTLRWEDIAMPEPGPGEVRVAVQAAGVNYPDTLIIRDLYQFKPPRPFAPGGEMAGVIDAVGAGVEGFAPGDRVLALTLFGAFASHVAIPAKAAIRFPDAMPFETAAAFIFTYGTSYYGLHRRGNLARGETLLVLGAAGGIGASAVELGVAHGARVIAAVSTPEKAAFARELGAETVLKYPADMDKTGQKTFGSALKQAAPDGIDVIYDPVGGPYAEPALRAIGWEGRYLVVGFPAGIPALPWNLPLLKSCDIRGVFWGAFTEKNPGSYQLDQAALFDFYNSGAIKPRLSQVLPMTEASRALQAIETRRALGKIVLTVPS
ncbi:MAG: NADPH:quinone oxidoreductase family protein [Pseudomonadota bacterium]